jgi:nucleotide-binding universal stress UspA family protein
MTIKPVTAATDGSEESLRAVEWAAREAVVHDQRLRIISVPMLPPRMSLDPAARETVATVIHHATKRALASAAERASKIEPGLEAGTELLPGPPTQAPIDAAGDASMLVVGSRGAGGFSAMVLGSVSRYVATHAACPVVVTLEETVAVHRQIVVGVNDPDQAAAALGFAFEEALLHNARLLAVHAVYWSLPPIGAIGSVGRLTAAERAAVDPVTYRPRPPSGWIACSPCGGTSTRTWTRAGRSCMPTRRGCWPGRPPGPTWWCSAGAPPAPRSQASPTRC